MIDKTKMKVKIELRHGLFEVYVTNNDTQWNLVYSNEDLVPAEIVANAYISIGYEDTSKYDS